MALTTSARPIDIEWHVKDILCYSISTGLVDSVIALKIYIGSRKDKEGVAKVKGCRREKKRCSTFAIVYYVNCRDIRILVAQFF